MQKASAQDDSKIGKRIRERRKLLGLSLADVGAEIGVSLQQVHKYETGCNALCPAKVVQFALVLRTEPGELFGPAQIAEEAILTLPETGTLGTPFNHTAETIELTAAFAKIRDPRRRLSVIALVETLSTT
ncbi:helix-turn-helix domain-containing protein [Rhizobium sp. S152]|uniref:helix-turn-helix domain-containing protein n=1 Tax=Rhizobium sp. S152 TaxID=3055038 RepID=UPI0025A97949|nr:helix-turn-helix domain-containing protein [Rhizobium sp. S152]MDM9628470.1 helix-turn-helix domain-containing protein [Rhizobium sp. S152]